MNPNRIEIGDIVSVIWHGEDAYHGATVEYIPKYQGEHWILKLSNQQIVYVQHFRALILAKKQGAPDWFPGDTAPKDGTRIRLKWKSGEDVGHWTSRDLPRGGGWDTDLCIATENEHEPIAWTHLWI